jgi:hypothetical protein
MSKVQERILEMDLKKLLEPFSPEDLEFRAGATSQDKTRALALPYITSRSIMDRLDQVCGPENWQDMYTAGPNGGVLCGLSIRINDEWITKFDGADNTNVEAIKGGLSDAFKRAAVKWGIGRYLYGLPVLWVRAEQRGKSIAIDENEARAKLFGPAPTAHQAEPPPRDYRAAEAQRRRAGETRQDDPRQQFYALGKEAIAAGRLDSARFNALAGRGPEVGWPAVLEELLAAAS